MKLSDAVAVLAKDSLENNHENSEDKIVNLPKKRFVTIVFVNIY